MNKETVPSKSEENANKNKHSSEKINKVILVQIAVCAFFVLLVFATAKLSPSTFDYLKAEYERIMAVDMSPDELLNLEKNSNNQKYSETIVQENNDTESQNQLQGQGGEDADEESDAVAVMYSLGKNSEIVVPLHGRITSPYGYRTNPISGKYGLHTGIDIAAEEDTPIVVAYNGVVKETGYGEKKGNFVLMEHTDGTQTLYCHCSEILVVEGAVIRAGEVIALVGSTGWSTGPHLHFEIHKNGSAVDPLEYLDEEDGKI